MFDNTSGALISQHNHMPSSHQPLISREIELAYIFQTNVKN